MRLYLPITLGALLVGGIASAEDQPTGQTTNDGAPDETVYFETGSAELGADDSQIVAEAAQELQQAPSETVVLKSYADPRGTEEDNDALATERAEAVREELIDQGVEPTRILIAVVGETGPREDTYAKDRRVEIETPAETTEVIVAKEGAAPMTMSPGTTAVRLQPCQGRTTVKTGSHQVIFDKACPQE